MTQGVSAKFTSYSDTIPRLLKIIKFDEEVKKHNSIVLKPFARDKSTHSTSPAFLEQVLRFCLENKNSDTKIFIAEGSDGTDTLELFSDLGYKKLAERYNMGVVDLNSAETEEVRSPNFVKFESILYPKILKESFVVSLPVLSEDIELGAITSLSNMIGAFPAKKYKGLFSKKKDKIRNWPLSYSIHDVLLCKMPDFALIDASEKGFIFAGKPLYADKQAVKLLNKDAKSLPFIRMIEESQNLIASRSENKEPEVLEQ